MHYDLNKIVLITGAAGRLGKEFSRSIIDSGGSVFIIDNNEQKLLELYEELGGKNVSFKVSDVISSKEIEQSIDSCVNHFGRVDAIVNAAYPRSPGWGATLENLKPEHLFEDLNKQLGGAILLSKQVIKHFQRQGYGHLIHISSIQGIAAPKFEHYENTNMNSPIEYTAIKSGIIAITRWLAKRYRQQNIRVNCISLGGILELQPETFLKRYQESCNSKGMLNAEDISSGLIYLLSDQSQFLTGQNLIIDDGWSL